MPAIYLSHGAPPLADDALWTRQLFDIGRKLAPLRDSGVSSSWAAASSPTTCER